jgi:hypothetical protein
VTARGTGFEPNVPLQIVWQGFKGAWKTDADKYLGRDYSEELQPLTQVKSDATGAFETTLTIPEGFGFLHDVRVMQENTLRNKGAFYVEMEVSMSATSGPVGTPIVIEAQGIGWRPLESSWDIIYDNKFTGLMSAVSTNGRATVTIPATGSPGKHIIRILHGSFTFPYMNMQQSPDPGRPTWTLEFTVTKGSPVLPQAADKQGMPREAGTAPVGQRGAFLWTDYRTGPVGSAAVLKGGGITPNETVELLWYRVTGNRVGGQGWDESATSLGKVTVAADGTFNLPFKTLDDLGGDHRIEALVKGEKVAQTLYGITPAIVEGTPGQGPAGTMMTLHLKGGGWTETANIYTVVYDNAYIGYSCAFNSQGDITVFLPATGEVGWHFIDFYPAIYKGKDIAGVETFRIPQLTFARDHPGEKLPAFHFAFQVTDN